MLLLTYYKIWYSIINKSSMDYKENIVNPFSDN